MTKSRTASRYTRLSTSASAFLMVIAGLMIIPAKTSAAEIHADVVAMDQVIVYNRMGAFNPAGMMFALARDVFPIEMPDSEGSSKRFDGPFNQSNSCAEVICEPGNVQLRPDKRPRPITLRVNEGDTLVIRLTNLLAKWPVTDADNAPGGIGLPGIQSEQPATRNVSVHVQGMQLDEVIEDDGSKAGRGDSLVAPGDDRTYRLVAEKEGAYTLTSGPNLGGEGGSGAIANGLFGIVNVEPAGSEWYRSQLTRRELEWATTGTTPAGQPIIDYDALYPAVVSNPAFVDHAMTPGEPETQPHPYAGSPILKILTDSGEIFHSDLNAIVTGPGRGNFAGVSSNPIYPAREKPFREYTVAFHDEIKVVQAFPDWYEVMEFTLDGVKDGFAINYGTGGIGSEIIANRLGKGPMKDCVDCKYEEFFLTSWAVGDPAMIVDVPATLSDPAVAEPVVATKAFYPDDPANVFHGYINDRTKVRNIHVGTEHHIFHLHAHQWLFAPDDDNSSYLDSQAIGPGSSFTYEIAYSGGGNRNKSPGDAILHCHFYPHFAQGMWGLWRVHDVFEMGTPMGEDGRPTPLARALPDGEIAAGTPIPAVVPIPGQAMAPMPAVDVAIEGGQVVVVHQDGEGITKTPILSAEVEGNPGYPFYIPGVAGHRPPTPPMDIADGRTGGIPRHVITGGTAVSQETMTDFTKELISAVGFELPENGTSAEQAAMAFHGTQSGGSSYHHDSYTPEGSRAFGSDGFEVNGLPPMPGAPYADPCRTDDGRAIDMNRTYKASVIQLNDLAMNKAGWHFSQQRIVALDTDIDEAGNLLKAPEPFVMRANSGDCIEYQHTNRVPHIYEGDDFQVRTPTDVIGQHIHLVKFDVTSSDGAANGWNYEDGTLSPDEITERIEALTNPDPANPGHWTGGTSLASAGTHRTTIQRWYVDPVLNNKGEDRGLGNVFTHDHFGPSTHQQVGLYAALLVEPRGSVWRDPETGVAFGGEGMPEATAASWRADILPAEGREGLFESYREFYLEFADFQLAYWGAGGAAMGRPVNPPDRKEIGLPDILETNRDGLGRNKGPRPEAISAADPGTFVVNYRNEPLALRVVDPSTLHAGPVPGPQQAEGLKGDMAFAFSSTVSRNSIDPLTDMENPDNWPYNSAEAYATASTGAMPGDPFTPILRVYPGDPVSIRSNVGAHEEGHNFSINGIKWLQEFANPSSGFTNSQMMGISEYFRFEVPSLGKVRGDGGADVDDYLYRAGSSVDALWNGSWGLLRAYADRQPNLMDLPNNPEPWITFKGKPPKKEKPAQDQIQHYTVVAVAAEAVLPNQDGLFDPSGTGGTLVYNDAPGIAGGPLHDPTALMYVLSRDLEPVVPGDELCLRPVGKGKKPKKVEDVTLPACRVRLKSGAPVEPLILRAAAGRWVDVDLYNKVLLPAVDGFGNMVFDSSGNPVFEDNGQALYVDGVKLSETARASVAFDTVPDLDGFNSLPMIVEHFNANDIRPSAHVGLHPQLVGYDVSSEDGMNVGYNADQTAAPGEKVSYRWYAGDIRYDRSGARIHTPVEFGAVNLMPADPIKHSNKGLVGALIIEPEGSTWVDDSGTRASATVFHGMRSFRDFVLVFQDDLNLRFGSSASWRLSDGLFAVNGGDPVPTVAEEEDAEDSGMKGINYRSDPIWYRLGLAPTADAQETRAWDFTDAFSDMPGAPVTPIFTADTGEEVRFRILKPGGHSRNHVFTLHGHLWTRHPFSTEVTPDGRELPTTITGINDTSFYHGEQMGHGPSNHFNVVPKHGAGGIHQVPGDYLYRDMVPVHVYNGIWGLFRVDDR
ncbi:MAG: hypothetical protein ACOWWM_03015 [Desulfobacterales bacterium]